MVHATSDSEQLVSDYVDVWNGYYAKLDVFSESFSFNFPTDEIHGRDAFEEWLRELNTAFPDARLRIDEMLASDEIVMVGFTWAGTHEEEYNDIPPTGADVEFSGMGKLVISDGKIQEARSHYDSLDWLAQLGIEPQEPPNEAEQAAKDAVQAYIDAYNAGNTEEIEELLTEDFVVYGLPGIAGDEHGREAFLDWLRATFSAFPDKHTEIKNLIVEDDTVAARWRSTATHEGAFGDIPATNRTWTAEAQTFVRVIDGNFAEMRFQPDQLGMLQQLGVFESPDG
ncbi:ester cyclase [Natrialbaceae archaeon A-CW3]